MSRDKDYDPEFFVLNDFRNCHLNTSKGELLKLINLIGGESKVYGSRKISLLTNSANQVTFGEYIKYLKREDKINMLTCSTLEKALIHLDIDVDKMDFIEKIITELEHSMP